MTPPGYPPYGPAPYGGFAPPAPQRWENVSELRRTLIVMLGLEVVLAPLMMVLPPAGIGFGVLFLAIAVVLLIWLFRARRNAAAGSHQFAAGWEIGGWFVPLANFYIPLRVVLDIGRAGAPAGRSASVVAPIAVWWAAWVLSLPTGYRWTGTDTSFSVSFSLGSTWASAVCLAVAAAALAVVVHRITVDQERAAASTPR